MAVVRARHPASMRASRPQLRGRSAADANANKHLCPLVDARAAPITGGRATADKHRPAEAARSCRPGPERLRAESDANEPARRMEHREMRRARDLPSEVGPFFPSLRLRGEGWGEGRAKRLSPEPAALPLIRPPATFSPHAGRRNTNTVERSAARDQSRYDTPVSAADFSHNRRASSGSTALPRRRAFAG